MSNETDHYVVFKLFGHYWTRRQLLLALVALLVSMFLVLIPFSGRIGSWLINQYEFSVPTVSLGPGTLVIIGENQVAEVYGPDMCETGFEDNDPSDDIPGCTLLTGKNSVEVTLVSDGLKAITENWTVKESVGPNGTGISLIRPNGWVIRQPKP